MITVIFTVLLVLTGLALLVASRQTYQGYSGDEKDLGYLKWVGVVFFALAGLTLLAGSVYRQDVGEVMVIKSASGDIADVDTSPGWGFTAPWNKTISFNTRNQRIEMFSNAGGDGDDGAAIQAPLSNGSNVSVSVTIRYRLAADKVDSIYREYRSQDNLLDTALKPGLRDEVRVATAEYDAFEVKQSRASVSTTLLETLNERWADLGVEVTDVDLGDLRLDEATEASLQRVNERQAEAESARADLERAQIEAEVTKTEAQASADADQIIRCGATVTLETREVAGQETEVAVIVPKTGVDCENRLNEQVLISNYIEALEELGANGNVVVVPNDIGGGIINLPTPQPAG